MHGITVHVHVPKWSKLAKQTGATYNFDCFLVDVEESPASDADVALCEPIQECCVLHKNTHQNIYTVKPVVKHQYYVVCTCTDSFMYINECVYM